MLEKLDPFICAVYNG